MSSRKQETPLHILHPCHLVEFVNPGRRPRVKQIDIVVTKWLTYDEGKKKCVVKYPPPPYGEESYQKLEQLLADESDAPKEWFSYFVRLRGKARE